MAFSFLPREDQYFAMFSEMTGKIQEATQLLIEMMDAPHAEMLPLAKRVKTVEHECDEITHNVTIKLNKSFITPFDREDIYTLSVALDDVCDYVDASARAIVMYDIHTVDEHAKSLARILHKMGVEMHNAVALLNAGTGMKSHLLEIQRLENEADEVYSVAMSALFKNSNDAITVIKLKELYEILENGTDRCESVGNIIESIVLKHN